MPCVEMKCRCYTRGDDDILFPLRSCLSTYSQRDDCTSNIFLFRATSILIRYASHCAVVQGELLEISVE